MKANLVKMLITLLLACGLSTVHAAAQNLFISDWTGGHIYKFTTSGVQTTFASGLSIAYGLAFDSAGNLFVADEGSGNIYKFTPDGVRTTFASGLNAPLGLAFNSAGNIFVGEFNTGKIYNFTPGGVQSIFASGLSNPHELAFNSMGNLFVAQASGNIIKITPGGVQSIFASGLGYPDGMAFDRAGNLFVSDGNSNSGNIYKFTTNGVQSTFATGLSYPDGLAFNSTGDLFESDTGSGNIYEFTSGGVKSTFASGLYQPNGLAFEPTTNQSITSLFNTGILSNDPTTGQPTAVSTDGAQDTHYRLVSQPSGAAASPALVTIQNGFPIGPNWMSDTTNSKWVSPQANENSSTGGATNDLQGNYIYRTTFVLSSPAGVTVSGKWATDNNGLDILINGTSTGNTSGGYGSFSTFTITNGFILGTNILDFIVTNSSASVNPSGLRVEMTGTITPISPFPTIVAQPSSQSVYIGNNATFTVSATGTPPLYYQWLFNGAVLPIITTAAGGGNSGDGSAATNASLNFPEGVVVDKIGNFFIADTFNYRIRKVDTNGTITTVAGNGSQGYSGDNGAATSAKLYYPESVAVDGFGNLFIADTYNNVIRKVATNGIITTVAGTGIAGYLGDGGPATSARLNNPRDIAVDNFGHLYIADAGTDTIRKVDTNGIITTVAGNAVENYSGDGGPATNASLGLPSGVVVDGSGNLFIADLDNSRIRKVNTNGIITTVAGNGSFAYSGDGGMATNASLSSPFGVAADTFGNLFIAENGNNVVRKVDTNGIITTVAGNGTGGFSGDGGPATGASLFQTHRVTLDNSGNLFVADANNNRIREVSLFGGPSLFLNNVGAANMGNYQAIVSDAYGSTNSSVATLVVTGISLLTVNTNGYGTFSPNYNGGWLVNGQTYSMTATPTNGEVFFRWIGSQKTNWPVLNFQMTSNLMFTAIFANPTNPPIAIDGAPTNQLTVLWPLAITNYFLQTNADLTTTNWGRFTGIIFTNGTAVETQLQPTNGGKLFFRLANTYHPPVGMALIPAGLFTIGDTLDGEADAVPVSVNVSAFFMDTNLVSYSQWQTVYNWAITNGYVFANTGAGKAANHPVQLVDWYDCVKWCNARSEMEGRTPAYYADGTQATVYRTGELDLTNGCVNWNAGYRLPTEAEWEKAARGGLGGLRFPWGNTISESQANYYSTNTYSYDLGPYGYNATYATGAGPYTSPVGSFAANGYGLYDMAGNVFEWCWDWYGTPYAGGLDPRGPASNPNNYRILRGGLWSYYATLARCAARDYYYPNHALNYIGFRCVRGL